MFPSKTFAPWRAVAGGLALSLALSAGAAAETRLRMTIWSANEAHLKLFNGIAESFKKENPEVTVSFESLPFETYTTALTTRSRAATRPTWPGSSKPPPSTSSTPARWCR